MMNKQFHLTKLILLVGFSMSFLISIAQDYYEIPQKRKEPVKKELASSNSGFSIAVSAGPAIPFKNFVSTNVKNSFWDFNSVDSVKLQGFAKSGIHFNLTASYLFPGGYGIMFMLGKNSNAFDITSFSKAVGVPFGTSESYSTQEYLIGPFISFSEWSKFEFEANAMIGLVTANYPMISQAIADTMKTIAFNAGRNFGFSLGGQAKYNITNKIGVSIGVSYTQSKMIYRGWTDTYTAPGYYPYTMLHSTDVANMSMGILKFTGGIVFKFQR